MTEPMKVKTVSKIDIYVSDDGKFFAEINGKIYTRSSLNALVKLAEDTANPLKVMIPEFGWGTPRCEVDNITSVNGSRLKGYKLHPSHTDIYLYNSEVEQEFAKIKLEYMVMQKRWGKLVNKLVRVQSNNFERLREHFGEKK